MDVYVARASGAVGYDIIDPEGEVVASAVDGWQAAAVIVDCSTMRRTSRVLSAAVQGAGEETRPPPTR